MKILFLDVDGVLNNHGRMMNMYCGIQHEKVNLLNRVLDETGCYLVISSAWRYMVLGGDMTIKGFEHMLLTHGLKCHNKVIGCTPSDEDYNSRGKQISEWLDNDLYKFLGPFNYSSSVYIDVIENGIQYVVVDDLDDEIGIQISQSGHNIVQTDGKIGLTHEDCNKIISMLRN